VSTSRARIATKEGRDPTRPSRLSWGDWWAILKRFYKRFGQENLTLIAAGVAFYSFFALFPLLTVLIGIYGLFADPVDVQQQIESVSDMAPEEALGPVREQLQELASTGNRTLSFATLFGLGLALWLGRSGVSAMITGLNVAYREREGRGFFTHLAISLALTFVLIMVAVVAIAVVVAVPLLLGIFSLNESFTTLLVRILRWPLAMGVVLVGIGLLYRYGPARSRPRLPWLSWGAVLATVFWLVASFGFSFYVSNIANYNETYGSLGAIIALLMWFFVSALVVLCGALLNAEMEHQTRIDTTVGPPQPRGERGAFVADHVPPEVGTQRKEDGAAGG